MNPFYVEGMTKTQIRNAYRYYLTIGYDYAIELLMCLGFTKDDADQYLFAEEMP